MLVHMAYKASDNQTDRYLMQRPNHFSVWGSYRRHVRYDDELLCHDGLEARSILYFSWGQAGVYLKGNIETNKVILPTNPRMLLMCG